MFLSVAQILDEQPELSHAVTNRDLNVSEMETLRQPPPDPLANNAGKERPHEEKQETTPRTRKETRSNVGWFVKALRKSQKTAVREVAEILQFFRTRPPRSHAVMYQLRKVMPALDYQEPAKDWIADWFHGANRKQVQKHHFSIRAIQGHCAELQDQRLLLRLVHIPIGFTAEHTTWVIRSTNTVLQSTVFLQADKHNKQAGKACYFSALHPLDTKHNGPPENTDVPQLVSSFHRKHRPDVIQMFDLEKAQTMDQTIFQTRRCHPKCLLRMVTFKGEKTPAAKEDHRHLSFPPSDKMTRDDALAGPPDERSSMNRWPSNMLHYTTLHYTAAYGRQTPPP